MIDRQSRDRLAAALRHYVSGQITNDDLDAISVDWRDRGAAAVKAMSWRLYSDLERHYATHEHALNKEAKRDIARWIVFLHSDLEYVWPNHQLIETQGGPLNALTLGWWDKRKKRIWDAFLEAGDFSVWPFCHRTEFEEAISHPRLLAGSGQRGEASDLQ